MLFVIDHLFKGVKKRLKPDKCLLQLGNGSPAKTKDFQILSFLILIINIEKDHFKNRKLSQINEIMNLS